MDTVLKKLEWPDQVTALVSRQTTTPNRELRLHQQLRDCRAIFRGFFSVFHPLLYNGGVGPHAQRSERQSGRELGFSPS
jgi:hypothetical protein